MTISIRGSTGAGGTGISSVSFPLIGWTTGSSPQPGDLVIIYGQLESTTAGNWSQTAGAGTYTFQASGDLNSTLGGIVSFAAWRVFQATDTAPTFTAPASGRLNLLAVAVTPDPGCTISIDTWATTKIDTTSGTTHQANAATASGAADLSLLLHLFVATAQGTTAITFTHEASWPQQATRSQAGTATTYSQLNATSDQVPVSGTVTPGTCTTGVATAANIYHVLVTQSNPAGTTQPAIPVPRRRSARAVITRGTGTVAFPAVVTGGLVRQRILFQRARGAVRSASGIAYPAGNRPQGFIYRRRPFRAETGSSPLNAGGVAGAAPSASSPGSPPGGLVRRRSSARAEVGASLRNAGGEAAAAFPAGAPPGGLVRRRASSRAVWAGVPPVVFQQISVSAVIRGTGVIAPSPAPPKLANAWIATYTAPSQPSGVPLPGPASLPVNVASQNTAGNWLFAVAAWRQAPGYPPVTFQVGDGTNRWEPMGAPGGTSPASGSVRVAVWRAPAARKVNTVAAAPTGFMLSAVVAVVEVAGLLPWIAEAATVTVFEPGVVALPELEPPGSAVPVFWLTACARSLSSPTGFYPGAASVLVPFSGVPGEMSPGQIVPGDPDIPLVTGSSGAWQPGPCAGTGNGLDHAGDLVVLTAFQQATGGVTAQWSQSAASDMAAICCGVQVSAAAPAQPNPGWAPGVFELAPGAGAMTPADEITWVPVDGVLGVPVRQQDFAFAQGQAYTVGSLQSGQGGVTIDNRDLAATPPGLGPLKGIDSGIPWRYRAVWAGGGAFPVNPSPHFVIGGFTRDLPASRKPDTRRGIVKAGLTDAWAYCQPQVKSALREEMLADNPDHLWPCSDAAGVAYASNLAPGSAAALVQVTSKYGTAGATAGFGASASLSAAQAAISPATGGTTLPGGGGSVWGQSGLPASPSAGGYCLYCQDTSFPALNSPHGMSVECWTSLTDPVLQQQACLWAVKGTKGVILRLRTDLAGTLWLVAADRYGTVTQTQLGTPSYLGAGMTQTVLTWVAGTGWIVYVNGSPVASGGASLALPASFSWITAGGEADRQDTGRFFNGQTCFLATFPVALPPSRAAAHWQAGSFAFAAEADHSRMERLLTYAGYTSKRVIRRQPLPDQTASLADLGQSSAGNFTGGGVPTPAGISTVQAGQQITALVASLTPAMLFVAPTGDIVWQPKGLQFGQPAVWTISDTGGIPYQQDYEFGWDPQRVLNDVQITQADRQDLVTPQAFVPANPAYATPGQTRPKYGQVTFQINGYLYNDLTTPLSSPSPSSLLDLANWISITLAAPHERVSKITIDAATYPAAWPLVLGVSPGDVALVGHAPVTASSSLSLLARVMRVERNIAWGGSGKGVATAVLTLDYAPELVPVILDDPVASVLDGTRVLAW